MIRRRHCIRDTISHVLVSMTDQTDLRLHSSSPYGVSCTSATHHLSVATAPPPPPPPQTQFKDTRYMTLRRHCVRDTIIASRLFRWPIRQTHVSIHLLLTRPLLPPPPPPPPPPANLSWLSLITVMHRPSGKTAHLRHYPPAYPDRAR